MALNGFARSLALATLSDSLFLPPESPAEFAPGFPRPRL